MRTLILVAATGAVVLPQTASAQACVGPPLKIKPNEFAIEGNLAVGSDATRYGANIDGRFGRVTVGGGYMVDNYDDSDENGHTLGAFTAIELPTKRGVGLPGRAGPV